MTTSTQVEHWLRPPVSLVGFSSSAHRERPTRRQQSLVSERSEEADDSETTSTSEAADEALVRPEWGGQLPHDTEQGESVCREWGLVGNEHEVDRGPEWRAFEVSERDENPVSAPLRRS